MALAIGLLNMSGEGTEARGFSGNVLELGPGEAVLQAAWQPMEPGGGSGLAVLTTQRLLLLDGETLARPRFKLTSHTGMCPHRGK